MNLRSVDLNLLVVLNALIEEEHVSRASRRLHLSQPATSAALARLRQLFDDPLLERWEGGMRLSPLAERLRLPLADLLGSAERLLVRTQPQLADIQQTIRICTADHLVAWLARELPARLARSAPGIALVFCPYHGPSGVLDELARGDVDLSISVAKGLEAPFTSRLLTTAEWRVVMREGHPAQQDFDLETWLAYPHVAVSGSGHPRLGLDDRLEAIGRSRRIGVTVPSFLLVQSFVRHSDLLAMLPDRWLSGMSQEGLVFLDPPIPLTEVAVSITWHERRERDVAVQHVRETIEGLEW